MPYHVQLTTVGKSKVSTIFQGDIGAYRHEPSMQYETSVFGGMYDGWSQNSSDKESAIKTHVDAIKMIRKKRA